MKGWASWPRHAGTPAAAGFPSYPHLVGTVPGSGPVLVLSAPFLAAVVRASETGSGIWRVWPQDGIDGKDGKQDPRRVREAGHQALAWALYFSLLSALHIGWRDLNVGGWIARTHPEEYAPRATVWVKVVSRHPVPDRRPSDRVVGLDLLRPAFRVAWAVEDRGQGGFAGDLASPPPRHPRLTGVGPKPHRRATAAVEAIRAQPLSAKPSFLLAAARGLDPRTRRLRDRSRAPVEKSVTGLLMRIRGCPGSIPPALGA
jgi:hypothetical protein